MQTRKSAALTWTTRERECGGACLEGVGMARASLTALLLDSPQPPACTTIVVACDLVTPNFGHITFPSFQSPAFAGRPPSLLCRTNDSGTSQALHQSTTAITQCPSLSVPPEPLPLLMCMFHAEPVANTVEPSHIMLLMTCNWMPIRLKIDSTIFGTPSESVCSCA
ncbi:hypothetical protein EJ03DRAFT_58276 [Teratosphaeria nubilosa]|uniref:Uncharacterized protein n=1 Tax=Teratosphaeria nubilosa TaxID=161662 RepID=A0A6G1KSX1_9PEZI|nr:hypothetical protein EJ03DRAFT_58276 [Teratosphaeria nubilosa]